MKSSTLFSMDKYYSISGLVICFHSEKRIETSRLYRDFVSEPSEPDININVFIGQLPESETGLYKEFTFEGKDSFYSCRIRKAHNIYDLFIVTDVGFRDSNLFYALDFSSILLENRRAMCHCSYILRGGEAVLFAGVKQIGKSTQAELWRRFGNAEIINGDRAVLKREGDWLFACGTPYCGSSKISVNEIAPVRAVILLAKGKDNVACLIENNSEKLKMIFPHISYDNSHMNEALDMAQLISESVDFYSYSCRPDREAVSELEKVLWIK